MPSSALRSKKTTRLNGETVGTSIEWHQFKLMRKLAGRFQKCDSCSASLGSIDTESTVSAEEKGRFKNEASDALLISLDVSAEVKLAFGIGEIPWKDGKVLRLAWL